MEKQRNTIMVLLDGIWIYTIVVVAIALREVA